MNDIPRPRTKRFTIHNLPAPDDYRDAIRACQSAGDVRALSAVIEAGWPADALLVHALTWNPKGQRRHATPLAYRVSFFSICTSKGEYAGSPRWFLQNWRQPAVPGNPRGILQRLCELDAEASARLE